MKSFFNRRSLELLRRRLTPVDDAPVANDDAYSTLKNVALNVSAPGVLGNDTDVENDVLSALLVANVTHGTLSLNANGGFLYTPVSNYVGSDVFTYRAYDAGATGNVATVTLTILATNTAPVANNDSYTTPEDTVLTIPAAGILTNDVDVDGDALTAVLVANVTHGTLSLNANGSFTYTPATNYNGGDSFTYRASDGTATSGVATVTINITPVNDAPVANNDTATTTEDTSVTINPLVNDSDPENDPLTITNAVATNGTVSIVGGTNLLFTPATNFNGTATITYTITDGNGGVASAVVTVTVTPLADIVVFKAGPMTGAAGSNLTFTITVTNSGPSPATNVLVKDQLPAGYIFVGAVPPAATVSNNLVSWPIINLAEFVATNYTITARPADGGLYTNIAFSNRLQHFGHTRSRSNQQQRHVH